jgi:F-type H+-transporting ATPase subunit b
MSAWAAEGEGGWGWLATAGRWFNLLLIIGILVYALRKPLPAYFTQRRQSIQDEIEEANKVRDEAEAKLAEVDSRMKALDSELADIRSQARQNAEAERQRLLEEARQDGEKIIAAAEREVGNLRRHAREELKQYASHLALEMAEEQIRQSIGDEDEERVVERFFAQLPSNPGG